MPGGACMPGLVVLAYETLRACSLLPMMFL